MSEKTWKEMHSEPILRKDEAFFLETNFNKGGVNLFGKEWNNRYGFNLDGYLGWMGYGGSVFLWHPVEEIGFSYTMNLLEPFMNTRGQRIARTA